LRDFARHKLCAYVSSTLSEKALTKLLRKVQSKMLRELRQLRGKKREPIKTIHRGGSLPNNFFIFDKNLS